MRILKRAVISLSLAMLCACGGGSVITVKVTPPPSNGLSERLILPSQANPGVDPAVDLSNVVIAPATPTHTPLFVFLPGTGAFPLAYTDIVLEAGSQGFRAIGLDYPNLNEVNSLCATTTDPNCWGDVRNEVLTGQPTSTLETVTQVDSITQRLVDLLNYLNTTYPTEGWGAYISGGAPVWSKIIFSGHSQGAGFAAFIGKYHLAARLCPIEGPADGNTAIPIASWVTMPNITPATSVYGFQNQDDEFALATSVYPEWAAIGLQGPLTDVDTTSPPYGGSHQLYTVVSYGTSTQDVLDSHDVTVLDQATPTINGTWTYAPVWVNNCLSAFPVLQTQAAQH